MILIGIVIIMGGFVGGLDGINDMITCISYIPEPEVISQTIMEENIIVIEETFRVEYNFESFDTFKQSILNKYPNAINIDRQLYIDIKYEGIELTDKVVHEMNNEMYSSDEYSE